MSKKAFFSWSEHFRVPKEGNKSMFARAFMHLFTYNDMFDTDFKQLQLVFYTVDWYEGLLNTVFYMLDIAFVQLLFDFVMVDKKKGQKTDNNYTLS